MSKKINNVNLGKAFDQMKAMEAAEERKRAMIQEFKRAFQRQSFSPWMAERLAVEKYNQIHNNKGATS